MVRMNECERRSSQVTLSIDLLFIITIVKQSRPCLYLALAVPVVGVSGSSVTQRDATLATLSFTGNNETLPIERYTIA
jgi:hypothetical protein